MFKNHLPSSLLIAVAMVATCALAIPSMASATSWGPVNSTHTLTSSTLEFKTHLPGGQVAGWSCARADLHVHVRSTTDLGITQATFATCTGTDIAVNCIATSVGTRFPWTGTAPATNNISITGILVDLTYVNQPGNPTACPLTNQGLFTLTGNLTGGVWDAAAHQVTYTNATGLDASFALSGTGPVTVTGTLRDATQTLLLFD
jgi:hypothetical protein